MEQRCHIAAVWLTWLGLPLLAMVVGVRAGFGAALAVLGVGILAQVLYLRWFPHISRLVGYGSVADVPAAASPRVAHLPRVTLYTANVCPFCPIIKRRLADLQRQNPFEVEEVDVTFRPEVIRAKGLRSVPVLEVSGRQLVGNATSAQIAEFLRAGAKAQDSAAR
ncbi:MAG TPA: glutaredoxin family protein [Vicinamibacterales bacterium]|nr:glutaredoxin family protein [Vicinamibacterales bacterium]